MTKMAILGDTCITVSDVQISKRLVCKLNLWNPQVARSN